MHMASINTQTVPPSDDCHKMHTIDHDVLVDASRLLACF